VHDTSRANLDEACTAAERLAEERGVWEMSQENIAAMRRMAEAYDRKDYQAVLAELDSAVEIDDTDIPETTGADSFLTWVNRWDEVWESWHTENLEIRPARRGQVVALFTMVAKGRASGVELRRADALVASFRDGKAVKLGYYNDQARALKAVGLEQ
jgi:ketosteroid isomerase-like protein